MGFSVTDTPEHEPGWISPVQQIYTPIIYLRIIDWKGGELIVPTLVIKNKADTIYTTYLTNPGP